MVTSTTDTIQLSIGISQTTKDWLEEQGELAKLYRTEGGGPRDGVKLPKTPDANGTVRELTKDEQAAYDRQFVRSF